MGSQLGKMDSLKFRHCRFDVVNLTFNRLLNVQEALLAVLFLLVNISSNNAASCPYCIRLSVLNRDCFSVEFYHPLNCIQPVRESIECSKPIHRLFWVNGIESDELHISNRWGGSRPMTVVFTATMLRDTMSIPQGSIVVRADWSKLPRPRCEVDMMNRRSQA